MKDLTLSTLVAVFEEMFGPLLFWALVVLAVAALLAFAWVVVRDRGIESHPFVRAELIAPLGAVAAILFVLWVTSSGLSDIAGPIDVFVLLFIGLAGAAGAVVVVYTALRLAAPRQT